jgi:DNA-binding XRE family transcriptional regulator
MINLSFNRVVSNVPARELATLKPQSNLIEHWQFLKDAGEASKSHGLLRNAVVLWKISSDLKAAERHFLDVARRVTMTYILAHDLPKVAKTKMRYWDPGFISTTKELHSTLDRMALAMNPSAWQLPVAVAYEPLVDELLVTFANGDEVAWDVLRLTQYDWTRAFVDVEEEPGAVGVYKHGVRGPVFFPATDVRRDTGTLPSKAIYPHELSEEDSATRAKDYGEFLKSRLEGAGMTQDELADKSGLSREHLNRIFNGRHFPRVSTLRKMAKGLGLDLKALLRN